MSSFPGNGPIPARVMLVGEAPGEAEERERSPFVGASGMELNRMLHEAGIMRSECFVTNVVRERPRNNDIGQFIALKKKNRTPAHIALRDRWVLPCVLEGYRALLAEIEMVQPNLIITFGNVSMWALTGQWGILKWRGSMLRMNGGNFSETLQPKVIPTIHPAAILREWSFRALALNDLRRAKKELGSRTYRQPQWNFTVRPTFDQVINVLAGLQSDVDHCFDIWLDLDIETCAGHIETFGISWSRTDAICIPLFVINPGAPYWNLLEESEIIWRLWKLLTAPSVRIRWQNGLYDAQYIYRHWHFIPRHGQDTMISHHSCFAALPKGLSVLASMYAEWYVYWKEEGKVASGEPPEKRWVYNLQDCVYTRECGEVLTETIAKLGLQAVDANQQALFMPVLTAMIKGVRVLLDRKNQMAMDIQEEISHRESFLYSVLGHSINIDSPKQMQALFYDDLKLKPILKRVKIGGYMTMRPTCDDEALQQLGRREPLVKPICNAIADLRTLGKFLGDFVYMPLDNDGRMRCSFNIAGDAAGKSAPYSYRLSSSKNPFGSGGNLQTIPSEKSRSSGKAAARGSMDFSLPNIRSMYGPDPGFTMFDMDLDRADLQVVVWESEEKDWMDAMRQGVDMHLLNAFIIDKKDPPPLEELVETHPKYPDHRGPRKHSREFAKVFCHASNYNGGAKTIAAHTGKTVFAIEAAQKYWFSAHPGIKRWHNRTLEQITKHRFVENRWGYRWYIFDRLDDLLSEALAWTPQSTIGILINKIWISFYKNIPAVQVLLQVHDSLMGQLPTHKKETLLPLMQQYAKIEIPYEKPLIIPIGIKLSETSWGDCK